MLESLLSVDDAVAAILQTLRETGRDEDTIVVFTSDNGVTLGEHRWVGKLCPYEECLRLPFVVRYPRLVGSPRVENRAVANIDLAPTFAEFAGAVPTSPVDGTSFASLLDGSASQWRTDLLHELTWGFVPPAYRLVRTDRFVYVEYPPRGSTRYRPSCSISPSTRRSSRASPVLRSITTSRARSPLECASSTRAGRSPHRRTVTRAAVGAMPRALSSHRSPFDRQDRHVEPACALVFVVRPHGTGTQRATG